MRLMAAAGAVFLPTTLLAITLIEAPEPVRGDRVVAATIEPNGNQRRAGRVRDGVLELSLVADTGWWKPADDRPAVRVAAFAEVGRAPQNPGPMLRVAAGTELRVSLRNALPKPLFVWGLITRPASDTSPARLEPGDTREFRFTAGEPGTYLYYARHDTLRVNQTGDDSQLNGALIVDRPGAGAARSERVFVISIMETPPDSAAADSIGRIGIWYPAINGRTWPFTERLTLPVGTRATWRWLNGSDRPHPMHLHGFYFSVDAKGTWGRDTIYPVTQRRQAVTETVWSRGTMDMTWTPERAGNWLVHCHMIPHIMPFWVLPGVEPPAHQEGGHAEMAMAGLILGITVTETERRSGVVMHQPGELERQLRLIAQESRSSAGRRVVSFLLQRGVEPSPDSVLVPGAPIVLRQDEPVAITVVNRLREPTSVHWHGMELDSYFDGVAGWSGAGALRAPLIAPGDSFTVHLVPPRAGTFMYHSHMDERRQVVNGAYGPLIVLAPHERWNPDLDRPLVLSEHMTDDTTEYLLDGRHEPDTLRLRAGVTYRFRVMNIGFAPWHEIVIRRDSATLERWTPIAKDGADLQASNRQPRPARLVIGVGETYDFAYTPGAAGTLQLSVADLRRRDTPWVRRVVLVQ